MDRRTFVKILSALALGGGSFSPLPAPAATAPDDNGVDFDVIVVGGGVSGLAAAHLLAGRRVLVLEKEARLGGRVVSGHFRGFDYPKGTEYIGEPGPDVLAWFESLDLRPISIPSPTDAVAYEGRIHAGEKILGFLPPGRAELDYERLADTLRTLAEEGVEEALFDNPEDLRRFANLDEQSVRAWLESQNLHPLVRRLVEVENRGLFGAANGDLSFLFNVPEMAWNLFDPGADNGEGGVYTFPRGMIEVIEALEKALGDRVLKGAEVADLAVGTDDVVSVRYRLGGEERMATSRTAILTAPAPIAARITPNALPERIRKRLAAIRYSVYVTLNLFLSDRFYTDSWSVSCLDDFFVTLYDGLRTQTRKRFDDFGILGVYIAPKEAGDRSLLGLTDGEILERTLTDLEKYEPEIRSMLLGRDIQRFPYAFPVFEPGYLETLETLLGDEALEGPVMLAGDYMAYPTFEGALMSAYRAAARVGEYL